jgi:hypothetical protein
MSRTGIIKTAEGRFRRFAVHEASQPTGKINNTVEE